MGLCGIILAAGESSRMGRDKALLPWPPASDGALSRTTFLSAAIRLFSVCVDQVLVVAGKNERELAPTVYGEGAALIVNPDPTRGQFSSLQTGVREVLNRGRDAAFITLVDRPPVLASTIHLLLQASYNLQRGGKWAIIPEFQGKHGHPFLAGREMIEAFLRAPDSSNAREVEHAHHDKIAYVAIDDHLVTANVDTPDQYAAIVALTK